MPRPVVAAVTLLLAATPAVAQTPAAPSLAPLFSDHAVLQRDRPIPVWGAGTPGAALTVELDGRTARTVVGADGRWRAELPAHAAGGPYELRVRGAGARRRPATCWSATSGCARASRTWSCRSSAR